MQSSFDIDVFLRAALAEDIGPGDITSEAVIPADTCSIFTFVARETLVTSGLKFLPNLFALISPEVTVELLVEDATKVEAGAKLAVIKGPARALLLGERTALNLLQQLSGTATLTARYVEQVEGTQARVVDTRKTIPGLRVLQKYAVRCGGGHNHRMGLFDGVLIKDNHIAVAGSVTAAVKAALAQQPKVEVECDTLEQVNEAIEAGAQMLLLDNMDIPTLSEAVKRCKVRNVMTEASGNVTLETIRAIAETGVDVISIGRLTHSAPAVDIGLDY